MWSKYSFWYSLIEKAFEYIDEVYKKYIFPVRLAEQEKDNQDDEPSQSKGLSEDCGGMDLFLEISEMTEKAHKKSSRLNVEAH